MSDMKKLLESMTKFAGEPEQKPGDQVRGHEKATKQNPFKGRLVGGANESKEGYCDACDRVESQCVCDKELEESLMQEYKYFVKEAPVAPAAPGTSPVANINPAATGTAATQTPPAGQPAAAGTPPANTATTAAPAKPGTPAPTATAPAAGQPAAAKPGAPAAPAGQAPAAKPGAPAPAGGQAAGTVTPPNPQQVKQQTDAITKVLNNPAHPMNAELQAFIKKAGSIPS